MSTRQTILTLEGHILWNKPGFAKELRPFAKYNYFMGTYVTAPTTVQVAKQALRFARQNHIQIKANKELQPYLRDAEALVSHHRTRMIELSRATRSNMTLKENLRLYISQAQLAGIHYAMLSPRCIIANSSMEDRTIIALGTLNQIRTFRALLVCSKDKVEYWRNKVAELLSGKVEFMDITEMGPDLPERSIVIADVNYLERSHQVPEFPRVKKGFPVECLIVDDAHLFKNDGTNRTENLRALAKNFRYQFMLTDYPVDLSYGDLGVLVEILGHEEDFEDLYVLVRRASRDPLENRARHFWTMNHQGLLRDIYHRLRATCMVRYADDQDLSSDEYTAYIGLSISYPDGVQPRRVRHPLHDMGIKKIEGACRWLTTFLQEAQGKTLVFAHHNTVIQIISELLGIPAYYGKTSSKKRRRLLEEKFQKEDNTNALLVANNVRLKWDLSKVDNIVFLELPRSPRLYDKLLSSIIETDEQKRISVVFLLSERLLDQRAYDRLRYREEEHDVVLDGDEQRG